MPQSSGSSARGGAAVLAGLFLLSLCLPALYHGGSPGPIGRGAGTDWGFLCLGAVPFVLFAPPWWANPLFAAGLFCLLTRRYRMARGCGILALLLAASTL